MQAPSDTLILIPTYNNAGTLGDVVHRALATGLPVMVVDDGSTDGTAAILGELPEVRVLRLAQNRGKGMALKTGFMQAKEWGYDYVITLDADGQHFPEDVHKLLEHKASRTLVVGSRAQRGNSGGSSFANNFSNFWFRLFTWKNLPDTQTGYRLYPLKSLPGLWLLTARYEAELALLVFSAWKGLTLTPVPVQVSYPENRVSHFRPTRDFLRISVLNCVLLVAALLYGWPRMLIGK